MSIYNRAILWLLGVCVIAIAGLFLNMIYPYNVIEVKNGGSLNVVPQKIVEGGRVGIVFDYCKHMTIRSSVVKNLIVNDIVYTLARSKSRPVPKGCHVVVLDHDIPSGITGKAKIHIYSSYEINAFRTVYYEWETKEFMIEASASAKGGGR